MATDNFKFLVIGAGLLDYPRLLPYRLVTSLKNITLWRVNKKLNLNGRKRSLFFIINTNPTNR